MKEVKLQPGRQKKFHSGYLFFDTNDVLNKNSESADLHFLQRCLSWPTYFIVCLVTIHHKSSSFSHGHCLTMLMLIQYSACDSHPLSICNGVFLGPCFHQVSFFQNPRETQLRLTTVFKGTISLTEGCSDDISSLQLSN